MKCLLIGSSFSAVPMLLDLKQRGAQVTVIGKYKGDPCHLYADYSVFEDYSDPEVLLKICQEHSFDYIVPTCNDYSYVAASYVAEQMGLPGFDFPLTTAILHTKDDFRRFCLGIGVRVPKIYGEVSEIHQTLFEDIQGSVLVKPVDSFSGRGVQRVYGAQELPAAIQAAFSMSRNKRAVVEEFVDGALHSHTAFIINGQVIWHDFVDEFCEIYPYQVDRSSYPSCLSAVMRGVVHESIKKIIAALNLCNGLLHTQFIASDREFWIIECMRRCPGDFYGYHFKYAFGYDYMQQYVASFVGACPQPPAPGGVVQPIERRVISVDQQHIFFGIALNTDSRQSIFVPLKESGNRIEAAPFDKAGILFLLGRSDGSITAEAPASRIISYD